MRSTAVLLVGVLAFNAPSARATPPIVPEAMVDACSHKPEDAPCVFTMQGKAISGRCQPLPNKVLACRPGATKPKPKAAPTSP